MKKTYEKPELNIVSYASSGALCAGCQITDEGDLDFIFEGWDWRSENAFTITEGCVSGIELEGYCKFTSASFGTKIFTS